MGKRGMQRGPHPPSPSGKEIFALLNGLPCEGKLSQNPSGMVFLDLDDDWIYLVSDLLKEHGYELPPYFYPPHPVGAHITLVTAQEAKDAKKSQGEIKVGKTLKFRVTKAGVSFPRKESYGLEARFKVWVSGDSLESVRRNVCGRSL